MKAFDLLMKLHDCDISEGKNWYNSQYELKIVRGNLKKNKRYYFSFDKRTEEIADVVLTLGGGDMQYLVEIGA